MAMDKTTTRRMIGAIVLVLVAALVLAYLLKSKNNQPEIEEVHDITLPSSPILEFPGDGSASGTAQATDGNAEQKVGLGVRPDGLKPAGDAVSDAAQAQQTDPSNNTGDNTGDGRKTVGGSTYQDRVKGANDSKQASQEDAGKSKPSEKPKSKLKEADVLSLDNGSKVSSSKSSKSSDKKDKEHKKSSSKPTLVGEKKLPKHSDKAKKLAKKDEAKKKAAKDEALKKEAEKPVADDSIPTTGFSIQLLATGSEAKANAVKQQMIGENYPAYITSVIKNGKTLYRVRVGAYQGHDEADNVQARMKRRYTKNSNVQNSLVVAN